MKNGSAHQPQNPSQQRLLGAKKIQILELFARIKTSSSAATRPQASPTRRSQKNNTETHITEPSVCSTDQLARLAVRYLPDALRDDDA